MSVFGRFRMMRSPSGHLNDKKKKTLIVGRKQYLNSWVHVNWKPRALCRGWGCWPQLQKATSGVVCVCVCVGDRMNLQRQLENFRQKTIKSTLKLCWVGLLELSSVSCPLLAPLLNVKTKLNENHPLLRTLPVDFTTAFPHGSTPLRKLYFLSPLILVPWFILIWDNIETSEEAPVLTGALPEIFMAHKSRPLVIRCNLYLDPIVSWMFVSSKDA